MAIGIHLCARLGLLLPVRSAPIGFGDIAADAHGFEKAAKKTAKRANKASKRGSQKRETLKRGNKNVAYAKRPKDATFREIDAVGRSLRQDRSRSAKRRSRQATATKGDQD